jgi:hypothetical protein
MSQTSTTLNENNRYIGGSDGQPINLAQTTGHFKLQLTKVRKFSKLADESNLQLNDDKKVTSVAQTKSETKTETKAKTKEEGSDSTNTKVANDCALNSGSK